MVGPAGGANKEREQTRASCPHPRGTQLGRAFKSRRHTPSSSLRAPGTSAARSQSRHCGAVQGLALWDLGAQQAPGAHLPPPRPQPRTQLPPLLQLLGRPVSTAGVISVTPPCPRPGPRLGLPGSLGRVGAPHSPGLSYRCLSLAGPRTTWTRPWSCQLSPRPSSFKFF